MLNRGLGVFSRERLFDDHVSRLGAYSRVGAYSRGGAYTIASILSNSQQ